MKKILRLAFLILVKEAYLLFKNLLGLIYHPYLTLKKIKAKKDFSQTTLILLSLITPLFLTLCLSLIYLVLKAWINISPPSSLVILLKLTDLSSLIFLLIGLIYLIFWTHQVLKTNHFYPKGDKLTYPKGGKSVI